MNWYAPGALLIPGQFNTPRLPPIKKLIVGLVPVPVYPPTALRRRF